MSKNSQMIKFGEPSVETAVRRGKRAGQDSAKRSQIIAGARRVFIDMGFDAASMNDITREAGVSKGTIYVYFANKEELFEALIEDERRAIFSDLYAALEQGHDLRRTLIRFGTALINKIASRTVMSAQRSVIGICERMPELGARFYERGPKFGHQKLAAYLETVVERGVLKIPNIELAAYQLTELCMAGIFRQRLFGYRAEPPGAQEVEVVVSSGVDLFLKAYAAPPESIAAE